MGLDKTLISLIINSTQNISKFELSIDSLQSQFKNGCPTKDQIKIIINKKNQISNILQQTQSQLEILKKTGTSLDVSTGAFEKIIQVITKIPAPTAVLGVGIPISSLTTLSSVLDKVGDKLKQGRGIIKVIPSINKILLNYINDINSKLEKLNSSIMKCLESEVSNMSLEEKENYFINLGLNLDNISNIEDTNKTPTYKGFKLTVEYDPLNKFTFPRRRIRAEQNKIILLGDYSYTSSVDILIAEMKFKIDNL